MGQKSAHSKNLQISPMEQDQEESLSEFYIACCEGNINKVKQLLSSMSIERINRFESNGSTALHAASHYKHEEIVQFLLENGACRTLTSLSSHSTPYNETQDENIRSLLSSRPISPSTKRFNNSLLKAEWYLDTSRAAKWKKQLSESLRPTLSFREIILHLKENYLRKHIQLSSRQYEQICWYFTHAYDENDATYIIRAYTSTTEFHSIVNRHLAQHLLDSFRWDTPQDSITKCVADLASIFIYRPRELSSLTFTGIVYRGLLLHESECTFSEGKKILNRSFLSTSKQRSIALLFAGSPSEITTNKKPLQYRVLCIYNIRNKETALDISSKSEIPDEHEVLIMPLCAFQVQSVRKDNYDNNDIHIEIALEECNEFTQ